MLARGSKREGRRGRRNERKEAERQGQHEATYPDNIRETRLVAGDRVAGRDLTEHVGKELGYNVNHVPFRTQLPRAAKVIPSHLHN